MSDPIDNGLAAVIKALDDVVAKSIDPSNPLAREQLKLVTRYLGFLRRRLPLQHERERYELAHYVALGSDLLPVSRLIGVANAPSLEAAVRSGQAVLESAAAGNLQIKAAVEALTAAISVLVRSAAAADPAARRHVEGQVVAASAALFDMQRAWYMPMDFEPDPAQVPSLEQALSR